MPARKKGREESREGGRKRERVQEGRKRRQGQKEEAGTERQRD